MPLRTRELRLVRLFFVLVAATALGAAGVGTASAGAATSQGVAGNGGVSWHQTAAVAVLPPPHDPSRGFCLPTRIGVRIRLDCVIKKADTTLWVACSGGFVEIRHISEGTHTAEGTCPQYGGYALTATSP